MTVQWLAAAGRWRGWWAATRRHPRLVDAAVAAGVAAVGTVSTIGRAEVTGYQVDGWTWLALVAVHIPLVWRRRAPVSVFGATVVLVAGVDLVGMDAAFPLFAVLAAVYAVARYRPRRFLWPVVAVAWFCASVMSAVENPRPLSTTVAMGAVLVATALLGVTAQTRRAYQAELEERARRLALERDQQARLAVAAERARIAREMHDVVAHHLAVMVALADGASYAAESAPRRAAEAMRHVSSTGRQALDEMRRLVGLLRDQPAGQTDLYPEAGSQAESQAGSQAESQAGLSPQPGLADLDRLVEQVRAAGVRVAVRQAGSPASWGPGAGLAVYRIVQEALTNTIKHAGPQARAEVCLRYTDTGVDLEIVDDGSGRPPRPAVAPGGGHGLLGMRERAASYGGRVEAGPRPGSGWRVAARLTFRAAREPEPEPA